LVIKSFKDKETKKIFSGIFSKKLPTEIQKTALRKLRMINRAADINDLKVPPANYLEKLVGNRTGQYSIRINNQYRICFEWVDKDAFGVEIIDYH